MINPNDFLCERDPRNLDHELLFLDYVQHERPEPRKDCACHNCFRGRDLLALEIIRLREILESLGHGY